MLPTFIMFVLSLVVFAVQAVAFVDAVRRPGKAFTSEGKLTKNIWLLILGIAGALGLLAVLGVPMGFLNVFAVAPAMIYWVDVRPRIQPYGTGKRRPQGPTGGW
ncbi:DUF2516 family protein [Isoptericola sp. BMS4]|uniref:DUF2516 family protein n=1 Tax=Isoptericola sp. BMS4 TaxID=2527875 RepID=UPI001F10C2B1|nr:DUF2516 family protein [Isoptericola sp. BMS4]